MMKLNGNSIAGRPRIVRFEMVGGKYRVWVAMRDANGKTRSGEAIYTDPHDISDTRIRKALEYLCQDE